ncbi:MAG: sulfurtransferase [Acidimicrobiia bacterium]
MHPLISAAELSRRLHDVGLYDMRWDLVDPGKGRQTYADGHIPGAVFVDLDHDLASEPGLDGRHPLPPILDFASTLGRLGIEPGMHVVVYDDSGGRMAARLWWMLRSIGHEDVQVLDGGFPAWVAEGGKVETGVVTPRRGTYPAPDGFTGVVTHDQLGDRVIVDARAGERYRGEIEPVDPKAGHIPGAVNIPTGHNLGESDRFHDAVRLAEVYREVPDDVVVSCGSGVTACHAALAVVASGRPMPDVYVGSFSEWSRRDLPVTLGPNP